VLHEKPVMAIQSSIIGVDQALKVARLDNRNLVIQNVPRPRTPAVYELTYRRVD